MSRFYARMRSAGHAFLAVAACLAMTLAVLGGASALVGGDTQGLQTARADEPVPTISDGITTTADPDEGGEGGGGICGLFPSHPSCGGGGSTPTPSATPTEGGGGGGPTTPTGQPPAIRNAIDAAQSALELRDDCHALITGQSAFTAQVILYTLDHNGHIEDHTHVNSPNQGSGQTIYATTTVGQGSNGHMVIWMPFTNPQAGGPVTVLLTYQGSSLSQAANWQDIFRTVTILHELGHATGAWGADSSWSAAQYADNLNSIIANCL